MAGLTVAALMMILTDCSSADAEKASQAVCQTPEAVSILATACGVSTAAVGGGGRVALAGLGTGNLLVAAGGAGVGMAGVLGAKRFCVSAVNQVRNGFNHAAQPGRVSANSTAMLGAYYSPSDDADE